MKEGCTFDPKGGHKGEQGRSHLFILGVQLAFSSILDARRALYKCKGSLVMVKIMVNGVL